MKAAPPPDELRRKTDARGESEASYRYWIEATRDLVQSVSPDGNFTFVNPAWCATLGWTREEALQLNFRHVVHPAQLAHCQSLLEALPHAEKFVPVEVTFVAKDGREVILEGNLVGIFADGAFAGTQCLFRDATERRRLEVHYREQLDRLTRSEAQGRQLLEVAERSRRALLGVLEDQQRTAEALRASEQRLRDLIDGLSPSIFVGLMTLDGTLIEANRPALAAAGLKPEDVLGKPVEETYWLAYSGAAKQQMRETVARAACGKASRYDMQLRVAEDQFIIVDFSLQPMRDETGSVVFLVASASVITERKQAEMEILKLNAELEQRVTERTTQLEVVNQELEAFSYSVSHDLKAPLRGIDGYSQLLEEDYQDKLDEAGRVFLHNIRQGAAQMHQLIEDLLAYSRMERRSLENVVLDLPACIEAVVAEYVQEFAGRGVVLQVDVPALAVHADRDGLAIVLRNLLGNALKFSRDARPPTIEIGARPEFGKVIFWVRDNGIGFDMKFHERIFEIFSRLQRAEDYPGTGVGLALVRKAMQRMGGRVWAESAPAQGAAFFLELPA